LKTKNKYHIALIFLGLFLFLGCQKKELNNLSNLSFDRASNFVVSSIQAGRNDEFYCIGKTYLTDSNIVRRYSKEKVLLEEFNLSRNQSFTGDLVLKYLQRKGWMISNESRTAANTTLNVFITDEKFSIIRQNELINMENLLGIYRGWVNVYQQQILSNGDLLLVCDTISWIKRSPTSYGTDYGIGIYRFDADLNLKHAPFHGSGNNNGESQARAVELNDQSLFYVYYHQTRFVNGILEQNGTMRYQDERIPTFPQSDPIGLSRAGENVLLNTSVNNLLIPHYILMEPKSGNIEKESMLPLHSINKGLAGPNALPEQLNNINSGHVLFSEDRNKLFYVSVDETGNLEHRFDLFLPEFTDIFAYRQMLNADGSITVGVSYKYKGKIGFVLQKLTIDGGLVN
jgi:hypothetical protein